MRVRYCFLILIFFVASTTFGQIATKTGTIYGKVVDEKKIPISGVVVQLVSNVIPIQSATTGSSGSFRFAALPPGLYTATFNVQGFTEIKQEDIHVTTGSTVELQVSMHQLLFEKIDVMGTPLLDLTKMGVDQTYNSQLLQTVPSGRDPWFLINMTPGVDSDRFNTASESGQQAFVFARGGTLQNNIWNYDGINNTDGRRLGRSPTFYDFDSFEEIKIGTAGNDASIQTGGISVNLVTKRGGNRWQGDGSVYFVNQNLQSTNTPAELQDTAGSNRISENLDYGFNAGGPIVKDKIFVWGGYRKSQINLLSVVNLPDNTNLTDYNLKLNMDWNSSNESQLGYFKGLQHKSGFALVGAEFQAPETLWEVKNTPLQGIWTAQNTWIPNDHLLVTARYGYIGEGTTYSPAGGANVPMIYLAAIPRYENTFYVYGPDEQPSHDINVDADYFKEDVLGGDHDFKFGFEFKATNLDLFSSYGNGVYILDYYQTTPGGPLTSGIVVAEHNVDGHSTSERASFYATDTFRRDRLTLNLGFRFDHQTGTNKAGSIPAVPGFEQDVPAYDYAGGDPGIAFNNVSPRLGATFDVNGDGKTVLRANFARYYDAFTPFFVQYLNPTFTYFGASYGFENKNDDRIITPDEITSGPVYYGGLNPGPFDLNAFLASRKLDPNLSSGWSNEYLLGVERQVTADLSVGATYVQRHYGNLTAFVPFGVTTSDYVPGGVFSASTVLGDFNVPYFVLGFDQDGSANLTNIKNYSQTYRGLDFTVRKRMSTNFSLNGGFTIQRQVGHFHGGDSLGILGINLVRGIFAFDPTNLPFVQNRSYAYPGRILAKPNVNPFSEWNLKVSGVYQFPSNVTVGAYLRYQQGYPFMLLGTIQGDHTLQAFYFRNHKILLEPLGSRRLDNVFTLDLRIEKGFDLAKGRFTGILDIFNVTNANTVLSRNPNVGQETFNAIGEVLSPRAFRLGARYSF